VLIYACIYIDSRALQKYIYTPRQSFRDLRFGQSRRLLPR
jgi:hypothetical protein